MAADFIPRSDTGFADWLTNFAAAAATNATALGLVTGDTAPLAGQATALHAAIAAYITAQAAAQGARASKDGLRESVESTVRALVRRIQAAPGCTDAIREALEITVPDRTPTTPMGAGSASRPIAAVDTSQRLRHEIKFWDENTPTSRRRPEGAMGCEIWMKVDGTAPAGEADLRFVALDTASPYLVQHEQTAAGKMAYYMLRWSLKGGGKGPWSETVAATVTA